MSFQQGGPKKTACCSYVQPWLVVIGGWRLATGGWRLVAVGGWWRLMVDGWWSMGAVLKGGPGDYVSPYGCSTTSIVTK